MLSHSGASGEQQAMKATKAASPMLMESGRPSESVQEMDTQSALKFIAAALLANRAPERIVVHIYGEGAQNVAKVLIELAGGYGIRSSAQSLSKAQSAHKFKGIRTLSMNNSSSIGRAIRNLQKLGVQRLLPIVIANDQDGSPPAITEDSWKIVQWKVDVAPSVSELATSLRAHAAPQMPDTLSDAKTYEALLNSIITRLLTEWLYEKEIVPKENADTEPIKVPLSKVLKAIQEMAQSKGFGSLQLTQQLLATILERMGHKVIRPANRLHLAAHKTKNLTIEAVNSA